MKDVCFEHHEDRKSGTYFIREPPALMILMFYLEEGSRSSSGSLKIIEIYA